MELTRKCKICGKNIFIERDRSTFFYDKCGETGYLRNAG